LTLVYKGAGESAFVFETNSFCNQLHISSNRARAPSC
jgi:hypothetical protein